MELPPTRLQKELSSVSTGPCNITELSRQSTFFVRHLSLTCLVAGARVPIGQLSLQFFRLGALCVIPARNTGVHSI